MSAGPCGSQRHQSHDDGSSTTATRRQSAGPVHVASWMISERTTDAAAGPAMASAAPAPSSAGTGASSNCSAAATTAVSSAPADVPGSPGEPSRATSHVDRAPAERHPERIGVVGTAPPHVGPRRGRRHDRLGHGWCRCEMVLPPGATLRRDRRRERGQLAPVDGARPPPVPRCADATGDPHSGGGEQPNRTEEQEQRRSHDERDDDRSDHRADGRSHTDPCRAAGSAMRTPARGSPRGAHRDNGRGVRCTGRAPWVCRVGGQCCGTLRPDPPTDRCAAGCIRCRPSHRPPRTTAALTGSPSTWAATRPVSCVNLTLPASATSKTPW